MKQLAFIFLFSIIMATPSCTMEQPQVVVEETVVADTIPPVVIDYGFPDTMYASAEKVMFVVDTFDTSVPCMLSDFKDLYEDAPGIFMFRGSPTRNPNFCGHLHGDSININVDWVFKTGMDTSKTSHGTWYGGTGWTGQPVYVQWPDSILARFEQLNDTVIDHLCPQELIIASLCGNVYFIDFQTGEESRKCLDTKNVLKGTPSLNPLFNGHLYVGHGVEKHAPFGNIVFDMFTHRTIHSFGKDPKAWRSWGAYDSSPVVRLCIPSWREWHTLQVLYRRWRLHLAIHTTLFLDQIQELTGHRVINGGP